MLGGIGSGPVTTATTRGGIGSGPVTTRGGIGSGPVTTATTLGGIGSGPVTTRGGIGSGPVTTPAVGTAAKAVHAVKIRTEATKTLKTFTESVRIEPLSQGHCAPNNFAS
jgi:hypothetical protein